MKIGCQVRSKQLLWLLYLPRYVIPDKVETRKGRPSRRAQKCMNRENQKDLPDASSELEHACKGANEGDERPSSSISKSKYPSEGYKMQQQDDTVNTFFTLADQEIILQKKNLCGDVSDEKCKNSNKKSVAKLPEGEKTNEELSDYVDSQSVQSAKDLKIDRKAFQCPISSCGDFICATFFSAHLKVEHSGIMMERINPRELRIIIVNPNLNVGRNAHCRIVYFLANKLRSVEIY